LIDLVVEVAEFVLMTGLVGELGVFQTAIKKIIDLVGEVGEDFLGDRFK